MAEELNKAGFSTLLFDLLTRDEEASDREDAKHRFNITFLAERLIGATQWVAQNLELQNLTCPYPFKNSEITGANLTKHQSKETLPT